MLKIENKIIDLINKHIIKIALLFVTAAAVWSRIRGLNYMGIDYHFSLYDIPGNCNSYLFRCLVEFLITRYPDGIIALLKILAYLGDFGVVLLTLILLREKWPSLNSIPVFFAVTACLLSPVSLLYSVCGMRIDSVSMCLLLLGFVFRRKGWLIPSVLTSALAAFLLPAYWPVVILFHVWRVMHSMPVERKMPPHFWTQTFVPSLILLCLLGISIFADNQAIADGYYWGKVFVVNPAAGSPYTDVGSWLLAMCRVYGYIFATLSLILSFYRRKLRIPALTIQLLVLALVGWYQTAHFAV